MVSMSHISLVAVPHMDLQFSTQLFLQHILDLRDPIQLFNSLLFDLKVPKELIYSYSTVLWVCELLLRVSELIAALGLSELRAYFVCLN